MYHAVVRTLARRQFRHLSGGRIGPFLSVFDERSVFCFAGDHALGGEQRGVAMARALVERMLRLFPGLRVTPVRIIVKGWPWNTEVASQIAVRATLADGSAYDNQGMQYLRLRWGKVVEDRVYEDTHALRTALRVLAHEGVPEAVAPPLTPSPTTASTVTGRSRPTVPERLVGLAHRLYGRGRDPRSEDVATAPAVGTLEQFRSGRHCVVVTYRRDGTPVATPVWYGMYEDRLYFRAEGLSGKAKRLRVDPHVRVAPCTLRGRPLGPPLEGTARALHGTDAEGAEAAIQANFGIGRRLYERWCTLPEGVYVEVTVRPTAP